MQATQPIFEEFSTSLRTVGFSNESEVTYATSFFSQVGSLHIITVGALLLLVWITFTVSQYPTGMGKLKLDSKKLCEKLS